MATFEGLVRDEQNGAVFRYTMTAYQAKSLMESLIGLTARATHKDTSSAVTRYLLGYTGLSKHTARVGPRATVKTPQGKEMAKLSHRNFR